eukprot:GHVU01188349.1.p1 GENE.GHVU01188349.1~~GHVU01188349.1.p1  ORF type:complete len:393 (-),score=90.52 GHVU01188349.1:797-1975(-)
MRTLLVQAEGLKRGIGRKNERLIALLAEKKELERNNKLMKEEVYTIQRKHAQMKELQEKQSSEVTQLTMVINLAQEARSAREIDRRAVLAERDMMESQVTKRELELASVYEQLRLKQSQMNAGYAEYEKKLQELDEARHLVVEEQNMLATLQDKAAEIGYLKLLIVSLEKDLLRENARNRTLTDELETNINVHRWRHFNNVAPGTYEVFNQSRMLQKTLIGKNDELLAKQMELQALEREFHDLSTTATPGGPMANQDLPHVLRQCKASLDEKTERLKTTTERLTTKREEALLLKEQTDKLSRDLNSMRLKYVQRLRKDGNLGKGGKTAAQQQSSSPGSSVGASTTRRDSASTASGSTRRTTATISTSTLSISGSTTSRSNPPSSRKRSPRAP